jgi:hypothetical protein
MSRSRAIAVAAALACPGLGTPAWAGEADVLEAAAQCADGICAVQATVRHADQGWEHYADHSRVLAPDGTEIARRVLAHPHDTEQPFTRSLGGVRIPEGIDHVVIEAHDKVHGYGGRRSRLDLPR